MESYLATDCGSTTTKAILVERQSDGEYRLAARGEAPTTVEEPVEDVTQGVINAVRELEDLRGRPLLWPGEKRGVQRPQTSGSGVDSYVSTSSAGGGLQMVVAGVVRQMTGESAARAALGAGAIVMDVLATNDRRLAHEKIERIRHLRPDMILMAGGTDGGTEKHVVGLAELLRAAKPRPRLGTEYNLPVIFAGNTKVRPAIKQLLDDCMALLFCENVRPSLEKENLRPAREAIHELFMEHVMAQAPGYNTLMEWTDAPIMPTPGAMGLILRDLAVDRKINLVGVDIGGATTDVFSMFDNIFNRTVSANLGMSYSISNVLAETGIENISRWVDFSLDEVALRDRIGNKMIRPTTIPQTAEELGIEQAIAREALRLGFLQHRRFAVKLRGVQKQRTISDAFTDEVQDSLVDLLALDLVVGSGGVLSHAPRREQSMSMMIDAFEVEGITELAVDSIFMMPHLGLLSTVNAQAARSVFEKDCLILLGTCIAPVGKGRRRSDVLAEMEVEDGPHKGTTFSVKKGDLATVLIGADPCGIKVTPIGSVDIGQGPGETVCKQINPGICGLVLDGRGRRPFGRHTKSPIN